MTFMHRANNSPEPLGTAAPLRDVNDTEYFYSPVLWALENGITEGTGESRFSPYMTCTRAQIVTFIYRFTVE